MNSKIILSDRKLISGKVLKEEDTKLFNCKIVALQNSYAVGIVLDAWKSIRRQSILGCLLVSNCNNEQINLLYDLKDITMHQKTGEFIKSCISDFMEDIESKHNIRIDFIINDGGGEMRKACHVVL